MSISVGVVLAAGLLWGGFLSGYLRRGTVEQRRLRASACREATLVSYWRKLAELRGER